jgi:type II secretion system protein J
VKIEKNIATQRAFTLIELILAIGVAAIVLVAANAVLFGALHLRDQTSDAVDVNTPVDATVAFLKRDLAGVLPPTNGTSGFLSGSFRAGNIISAGVSEPVAVEMFTTTGALGESKPWSEIQRVNYELKTPATRDAVGRDLYRSVTRNLLTLNSLEVEDQLMLTGVASVKFSGYDGAQWQDAWDTSDVTAVNTNLPWAVRVEIKMAGNANAQPIQVIVPIVSQSRTNMVLSGL